MSSPSITVAELATQIGARFEGDGARVLRGFATLALARADELAWLGDEKYLPELEVTQAAAVLVSEKLNVRSGRTLLRVADPDLARCEALRLLAPPAPLVPKGVHPSAVIGPGAKIDPTACIGPQVVLESGASIGARTQLHAGVYVGLDSVIGADCLLWPRVVVRERVRLGDRVTLHPQVTIGADGFGYLFRGGKHIKIPQLGTVSIEDDVEIGAGSTVDRAQSGVTRIGRGTKIDNLVQVGHNCDIGEGCMIVAQCGISGSVTLEPFVVLGGQVGIADHLRIGRGAQVAAKSGVIRDVPAGETWFGYPAGPMRDYLRVFAGGKRVPELVAQLRELQKRIEQLESAMHDQG